MSPLPADQSPRTDRPAPADQAGAPTLSPRDLVSPEPETLPPADAAGDPLPPCGAAPAEGVRVPGYEIIRELGRGGMGVVYEARQTRAGRLVALKMILSGVHAGAAELARFLTEAEAIARL